MNFLGCHLDNIRNMILLFLVHLCVEQSLPVNDIELDVLAAVVQIGIDHACKLFPVLASLKGSGMELHVEKVDAPALGHAHCALQNGEQVSLLPQKIDYYRDVRYLFPLLGNLVEELAPRAVLTAINSIV